MSTGRHSCPPDWAAYLTTLLERLTAQPCTQLQPLPLCDAAGAIIGYVALTYDCATGAVTKLHFDAMFNLTTAVVTGAPCNSGQCGHAQLFYEVSDVCLDTGAPGGVIEARQIILRDATGAKVVERFEALSTGQLVTGTLVECPC